MEALDSKRELLVEMQKSRERVEDLSVLNTEIREKMQKKVTLLPKCAAVSLATAQCIDLLGKTGCAEVDNSIIAILASLDKIDLSSETSSKTETDTLTKIMHKMLSMIVDIKRMPSKTLTGMDLYRVEEKLQEWLSFIEDDGIIPAVTENGSWKKQFAVHREQI